MSEPIQVSKKKKRSKTKRGRAWQCSYCPKMINEKSKVISHFFKKHVALDRQPYYCNICLFRTQSQEQLENHVHSYATHLKKVEEWKEKGLSLDESANLMKSSNPYIIQEGVDIIQLSEDFSLNLWEQRRKTSDNSITSSSNEDLSQRKVVIGSDTPVICSQAPAISRPVPVKSKSVSATITSEEPAPDGDVSSVDILPDLLEYGSPNMYLPDDDFLLNLCKPAPQLDTLVKEVASVGTVLSIIDDQLTNVMSSVPAQASITTYVNSTPVMSIQPTASSTPLHETVVPRETGLVPPTSCSTAPTSTQATVKIIPEVPPIEVTTQPTAQLAKQTTSSPVATSVPQSSPADSLRIINQLGNVVQAMNITINTSMEAVTQGLKECTAASREVAQAIHRQTTAFLLFQKTLELMKSDMAEQSSKPESQPRQPLRERQRSRSRERESERGYGRRDESEYGRGYCYGRRDDRWYSRRGEREYDRGYGHGYDRWNGGRYAEKENVENK